MADRRSGSRSARWIKLAYPFGASRRAATSTQTSPAAYPLPSPPRDLHPWLLCWPCGQNRAGWQSRDQTAAAANPQASRQGHRSPRPSPAHWPVHSRAPARHSPLALQHRQNRKPGTRHPRHRRPYPPRSPAPARDCPAFAGTDAASNTGSTPARYPLAGWRMVTRPSKIGICGGLHRSFTQAGISLSRITRSAAVMIIRPHHQSAWKTPMPPSRTLIFTSISKQSIPSP